LGPFLVTDVLRMAAAAIRGLLEDPLSSQVWVVIFKFVPMVVFLELPYYAFVLAGVLKYAMERALLPWEEVQYHPSVSCIIPCYSEGEDVKLTIRTLTHQIYPGRIQIIPVIDGALVNSHTHRAALEMMDQVMSVPNRELLVLPKWQRGGRVSSLNAGLSVARGEVVMALDGDTSFDNDMVSKAVRHFRDPNVAAVAGCLRVRNWRSSLAAALQGLEYMLAIGVSKTGLSQFNAVNNISGAFGIFRREVLNLIMGWDAGSAEDLDITMRIKNYFGRYRSVRILFDPEVIGHTDAPPTFRGFFKQRLRWDGDLFYIYVRKHLKSFSPSMMGWRNFITVTLGGLYFQIVVPLILLVYTAFSFITLPLGTVFRILLLVYLFYLGVTLVFYLLGLAFVSERPRDDLILGVLLPLFPVFTFASRLWSAAAVIWEMVARGHLDSSMAPWWVLRKGRF